MVRDILGPHGYDISTDELLRAKDDLLSEGGQSLNSIFAD